MTRAVGYYRVSTGRQATDDHYSLPSQQEMFVARCKTKGYQNVGEYVDVDSGRTVGRKAYQQMLADARAGNFDVIVVRAIDRFGRDQDEILVRTAELHALGVKIDPINSASNEGLPKPMARFLSSVEAFVAEQESAQLAARVKQGMDTAAAAGNWMSRPPYGYSLLDGKLYVVEDEAAVVRRIYESFALHNIGPRKMSRLLNEDEIPTRSGVEWSQQTINTILKREQYTGTLVWGGVRTEDGCPAIVSRDLWEQAQARRRTRKRIGSGKSFTSPHLLTGILYCGVCGRRMTARPANPKNYTPRHYSCSAWLRGMGCQSNRHVADDLERRVMDDLLSLKPVEIRIDPPDSPIHELARIKRELANIPARRKSLLDRLSRDIITDDDYLEAMALVKSDEAEYRKEVEELERQVSDAEEARRALAERPDQLQSLIDENASPQEKKAILQRYLTRVEVRPGDPEPYIVA